ncbi:MAG TPA: hypothetical protein PK961_02445 [bacterium]|nr:hypothetical protein [bacterium]
MAHSKGGRWACIVVILPVWVICTGLAVFLSVRFALPNFFHDYPEFIDRRESILFVDDQVHLNRFGSELLANVLSERLELLLNFD